MRQALKRLLFLLASCFGVFRKRRVPAGRRIGVFACNWLGDTFWALQTLPEIRRRHPDAEIFFLVKGFSATLFRGRVPEGNIVILDGIVSDRRREAFSPRSFLSCVVKLRKLKLDLLYDFSCNRYSAAASFLSGAFTAGSDHADEFHPLYSFRAESRKFPERLAFRPFAIFNAFEGTDFFPETLFPPFPAYHKAEAFARAGLDAGKPFALLVPGAGWPQKEWGAEGFSAAGKFLAEKGVVPLYSGSGKERSLCEKASAGVTGAKILAGALDETLSILPYASLVLCNDSGISHLAAASGVKTLILFCPTNPALVAPRGENVTILRSECPDRPEGGFLFCPDAECCQSECRMRFRKEKIEETLDILLKSGSAVTGSTIVRETGFST